MSDENSWAILLAGPAGAAGLYWVLYRYYRNTDKSHAFERESKVDAKPVTGSDTKVDTNNGTRDSRIAGNNVSQYRTRVQRIRKDGG
jgi:hypothetical protein